MNPQNESDAKKLDELLQNGGERHDARLKPFVETAAALQKEASVSSAKLSSSVKSKQRAALISMSSPATAPTPVQKTPEKKDSFLTKPWFAWAEGAFATAAAVVVIAFVLNMKGPVTVPTVADLSSVRSVARFVIPEVHAADAFSLMIEKQDASGADPSTSFMVSSTVAISADQLTQHLRLVPPSTSGPSAVTVPVRVTSAGENQFRVEPAAPLESGKIYRVELLAAIEKPDGSLAARDFSWAVQTKNVFRVTSAVPGPDSSGVPVNTGIEVTMSMSDFENVAPYFEISPKVDGRFETHGRSVAFIPAKPLDAGRVYTVTYKKGWKVTNSDRVLESDVVIRFETAPVSSGSYTAPKPYINMGRIVVEGAPGKDVLVPVWMNDAANTKLEDIVVTGYSLSKEEATSFLLEESDTPWFAYETRKRGDVYTKYAKNKTLEMKPEMQEIEYQTYLVLPKGVPAGRYVMKVQPKDGEASWFFLESTNVATYSMSDAGQTIVWAMNIETGRPLTSLPVTVKGTRVMTDESGIARFATPEELRATSTPAAVVLSIGEGDLSSIIRLESRRGWQYVYDFGGRMNSENVVSYLYVDRPIYRTTDVAQAFGVVQDRESKNASSNVTLELSKSGFFDFYDWNKDKVYRSVSVTPDASGFFKTSLDWSTLAPGYYSLTMKVDGKQVSQRSIEVRDFVKPAYTLEITTNKQAVYAGDEVTGEVRAMFFDGTPVGKMGINLDVSFGSKNELIPLTTDESGRATFRVMTERQVCDPSNISVWCPSWFNVTFTARPTDGEEAQIWTSESVDVWRSRASLEVETKTAGNQATLTFTARKVDLAKAELGGGTDVLGDPIRATNITGRIVEKRWDRIEDGTWYDFVEKKVIPKYRYELKTRDVGSVNVTTDAEGKATMSVPMSDDVYYTVITTMKDERGVDEYGIATFAKGWFRQSSYQVQGVSLEPKIPLVDRTGYHIGETVGVEFRRNDEPMANTANPTFLYVETRQGIRTLKVTNAASYEFAFSEAHVPNMRLHGVVFLQDGFVARQLDASFETDDRLLTVTLTPDKTSYAPGAQATVRIEAKKKDGSPAGNARVGVGVVDEAVFAAAQTTGDEFPLGSLYSWVNDGILVTESSHDSTADQFGMGGAEFGGGGGDSVRRNFKDTAAFEAVTLDGNGVGTMTMTMPDNITSWRVTAVAVTADRFAGTTRTGLPVTKPVFVDAVAPSPLLIADKPVMKLRAFGTGLPIDETLTFTVDAPTLGLRGERVTGKAGTPTGVAIETLVPGTHTMIIRVQSSKGTDAIEKKITVLPSRFLRNEDVETELGPGTPLGSAGESREAEIRFLPKNRAALLWQVRDLAYSSSQRVESKIAKKLARTLLVEAYNEQDIENTDSIASYQKTSGGIGILPYASEDAELTAKVAAIAPDLFDRSQLARYLWEQAKNPSISREEAVRAVSGLASVGEPVLNQLKAYAALQDLSWREELAIIRGLEASGDREAARVQLDRLLTKAEEADGKMFVRVAEDPRANLEATAEAASLAQIFAHTSAPKLFAWVEGEWSDTAMTDLDRIAYLTKVVPTLLNKDVSIGYTTGGAEQTIILKDGWGERVTLTAEEIKNFRATKVDGPAVAIFTRQVAALPAVSKDLGLTRSYSKVGGGAIGELVESDTVIITLNPTWQNVAPSGCYTIRDHVPAGLAPLVSVYPYYYAETGWYPSEVDGNAVSFIVCRGSGERLPLTYRARVVARGSYLGEPAVLQSIDSPSVAALSGSETVTIK